jgi:hypothetical protein
MELMMQLISDKSAAASVAVFSATVPASTDVRSLAPALPPLRMARLLWQVRTGS